MIDVIWGSNREKPESSRALAEELTADVGASGLLYIGYPVIGSPTGPIKLDALLVSPMYGLVAFDLVEGTDLGEYKERQDGIGSMLEVRLKPYPILKTGRALKFEVNVVTFAPAKSKLPESEDPYFISGKGILDSVIRKFSWSSTNDVYRSLLAAVQVVTSIRSGKLKREPKKIDSRGAKLKRVEESIANLDQHQSQAVIETVEGVQRIRGLAGSGKTIVLALKVAYLHTQNPEWKIAITFNTRSLKEQFHRLVNNFTIEQTGSEPDWDRVDIVNAWGAPGDPSRDGIYHKFCVKNQASFFDFALARSKFGQGQEFAGACRSALAQVDTPAHMYDLILVDEAQDLPNEFLRMCYRSLTPPGRLVYAYDELQTLTGGSVAPPEVLFGTDAEGAPLVRLDQDDSGPRRDIILEKCYRNSRPLLTAAHALGFGIYRKNGLVQIFDENTLWTDVGYVLEDGELLGGANVTLARTSETSPEFLESHSPPDDLIQFHQFSSAEEQNEWLVEKIRENVTRDELRPEDVVVINTDPLTTKKLTARARSMLFSLSIDSELAGVTTSADVFTTSGAVTFTGIFRAKGNEAGMVYIINAQDCAAGWDKSETALVRNRLFTAITRSKAWVRVLGIGPKMGVLVDEWKLLHGNEFKLRFRYPTEDEKKDLRIINKDLHGSARSRRAAMRARREALLRDAERGDVDVEELIRELKARGTRPRRV